MRNLINIILFVTLLTGCKEKTTYQMQVLIKNNTDYSMNIVLYPKPEHLYLSEDEYSMSSSDKGWIHVTEYTLISGESDALFVTYDLNSKPYYIISELFDSIKINIDNNSNTEIKFTPDSTNNYNYNIFSEDTEWEQYTNNYSEPDMFRKNPVESQDYYFILSENNITN